MKKAKIFLTALTVLAVVGGALAFKVRTLQTFYTCNIPQKKCNIFATNTFLTTTDDVNAPLKQYNKLDAFCDDITPCETRVTVAP